MALAPLTNRLLLLLGGCVLAAVFYPMFAGGPDLDHAALALALAGPAVAAALSSAVGRPTLAAAALAGVGAYASGLIAQRGVLVPVAVLCGGAVAAAAGAAIALACHRVEAAAFLAASLLLALAGGALVQALPAVTGAQSGLGPIPQIQIPFGASRNAVATPVGDFHVLLMVAALSVVAGAVALRFGRGPAWRAIGSDRTRAAASGIAPLSGEVMALALGGLLAGLSGALQAHVQRVAAPSFFTPDAAALPLLAALAAGREPLLTGIIAVATGAVAQIVLPAAGWHGPPDAQSVALGLLGVATVATLLPPRAGPERVRAAPAIDPSSEWPVEQLRLRGARLDVAPLLLRSDDGHVLVDAPAFAVEAGSIRGLVGANGSGKTTLLRAIAGRAGRAGSEVVLSGAEPAVCMLLPQDGGGWAYCTVRETLVLSARPNRTPSDARARAEQWLRRLNLEDVAGRLCAELPGGRRRMVDLARVILGSPAVLLCDEPLAGLDDNLRAAAVSCLRAASTAGLTIVIAEHDHQAVAALTADVLELERFDARRAAVAASTP